MVWTLVFNRKSHNGQPAPCCGFFTQKALGKVVVKMPSSFWHKSPLSISCLAVDSQGITNLSHKSSSPKYSVLAAPSAR